MQLVDSNDSNQIEGDLTFFYNYSAKFDEKKKQCLALITQGNLTKKGLYGQRSVQSPSKDSLPNSLDFDSYLRTQGVPKKSEFKSKRRLPDRIDVGLISAADCNVDVVQNHLKIRSSLNQTSIARLENQVSHCAINQITSILIDLNTKAQIAAHIFQNEMSTPVEGQSVSARQCISLTLEYLQCCQNLCEYFSQIEGGNMIQQRFQKFLLQNDSFAIDSVLHLLDELI